MSQLHGLQIEHNERIDDMIKIDFPEPNVGPHPGANGLQFSPSFPPVNTKDLLATAQPI